MNRDDIKKLLKDIKHKPSFISSDDFMKKYGVNRNALYAMSMYYKDLDILIRKVDGSLYINDGLLLAYKDFKTQKQIEAESKVTDLTDRHNTSKIAKILSDVTKRTRPSWVMFLLYRLFRIQRDSITNLQIPKMTLEFLDNYEIIKDRLDGKETI